MICPHGSIEAVLRCPQCGPQARIIGGLPDLSVVSEEVECREFVLRPDGSGYAPRKEP